MSKKKIFKDVNVNRKTQEEFKPIALRDAKI